MPNPLAVELPDLLQRPDLAHPVLPVPGPTIKGGAITGGAITGGAITGALPLRGLVVLAVEDSRFASEALRLMCQRLGARLRRAETLQAALAHLQLYRPDVMIVDLGLPDGRGEGLIRDVAAATPRGPVVIGTSGDPLGRALALAAGADGFLDKPLESLAALQAALIRHLPAQAGLLAQPPDLPLHPDTLALRDDLAHAAALIEGGTDEAGRRYLSGFLTGVAAHAGDPALAAAAADDAALAGRFDRLRRLLQHRLAIPADPFAAV